MKFSFGDQVDRLVDNVFLSSQEPQHIQDSFNALNQVLHTEFSMQSINNIKQFKDDLKTAATQHYKENPDKLTALLLDIQKLAFGTLLKNYRIDVIYKAEALALGLSAEDISGHRWSNPDIAEATIDYLKNGGVPIKEAMANVKELGLFQIIALQLGVPQQDLRNGSDLWHDPEKGILLLEYIKACNDIETEIPAFTVLAKKVNSLIKTKPEIQPQAPIALATPYETTLSNQWQIEAEKLGLRKMHVVGREHNWEDDAVGKATILFLKKRQGEATQKFFKQSDAATAKMLRQRQTQAANYAMGEIRGLNQWQIQAVTLGLSRDQQYDHKWDDPKIAQKTLQYLKNRKGSKSAACAMREIRGLNQWQIQAVTLGLSKDQQYGHKWDDPEIAQKTLDYLGSHNGSQAIARAMDKIRGFNAADIRTPLRTAPTPKLQAVVSHNPPIATQLSRP